ncbi:MAG: xanthine phosphoribosyltransferase [Chloroflexi bacterium]|nr:xanthine phosphoribosyltransferase [Chloroflexota bacterium]
MQALKDRIRAEGRYMGDGILKIDSILNHQIYPDLAVQMGQELANRFRAEQPTRILTAEVSGIAPALMTAIALNVPMVYARKHKPITMSGPIFLETAPSATHGGEISLMVAAEYLPAGDRILIIDDFLASGKTLYSLARMVNQAKCTLVGIGVVVEKAFAGGREKLEKKYGVQVESLASITFIDEDRVEFADDPPHGVGV